MAITHFFQTRRLVQVSPTLPKSESVPVVQAVIAHLSINTGSAVLNSLSVAVGMAVGYFLALPVIFHAYMALMFLDIVAAAICDIGPGGAGLSSVKVWNGFRGKLMGIILCFAAAAMSVYVGFPAGSWIAGALAFKEAVSIAESAARLGVLPEPFKQLLAMFRTSVPSGPPAPPSPTPSSTVSGNYPLQTPEEKHDLIP